MKNILLEIESIIGKRKKATKDISYVKSLLDDRGKLLEKISEESEELIEAADETKEKKKKIIHETADLWFHNIVLLSAENIEVQEVLNELKDRMGVSGLVEKLSRERK